MYDFDELTLSQINKVITMLGGEEGAKNFLAEKMILKPIESALKTWKELDFHGEKIRFVKIEVCDMGFLPRESTLISDIAKKAEGLSLSYCSEEILEQLPRLFLNDSSEQVNVLVLNKRGSLETHSIHQEEKEWKITKPEISSWWKYACGKMFLFVK